MINIYIALCPFCGQRSASGWLPDKGLPRYLTLQQIRRLEEKGHQIVYSTSTEQLDLEWCKCFQVTSDGQLPLPLVWKG